MGDTERERIHYEILTALAEARRRVNRLEQALAQNAAFLGTGIDQESRMGTGAPGGGSMLRYLEMEEAGHDISDYIGHDGDDRSRPRLGPDAPAHIRPRSLVSLSPQMGQLAIAHPDDVITIPGGPEPGDPVEEHAGHGAGPEHEPGNGRDHDEAGPVLAAAGLEPADAGYAHAGTGYEHDGTDYHDPAEAGFLEDSPQTPIFPDGDVPHAWLAIKDAGKEAEESYLRAYLALQAINDGIWDWNLATGEIYVSPRWREIAGGASLPVDSPLESISATLHKNDAENLWHSLDDLIAGRILRLRMAVRIRRPGDVWAWGMLRIVVLKEGGVIKRITAALADITTQREAELALRASEEKFRALAEDSPDFISRFDANCHFLYASPNIRRYLPVTPEEAIGRSFTDFNLEGDVDFFTENLARVFEMGLPVQMEVHLISPLVGPFVADCRFWPEFGLENEVVSVTAQVRDMTFTRRVAENYQALFTSMVDGFALYEHLPPQEEGTARYGSKSFVLIAMNPSLGRMLEMDESHSIGMRVGDLFGRDAESWTHGLGRVLSESRPVLFSLRSQERSTLLEISAYSPEAGRVACIVKDVTDLRRIEQEMRLNEARFAALYRLSHMDSASEKEVVRFSLDQAVQLTGSAFGFLYVCHEPGTNGTMYWSRQDLDELDEAGPEADAAMGVERFVGRKGETLNLRRARMVNVSGDPSMAGVFGPGRDVHRYMLAPIMEYDKIVCVAGVANKEGDYDATDLRQLELFINGMWFHLRRRWGVQGLQRAKEAAEAANLAKNEFLANVSHELRTPLNGILGMLQVLQQTTLTAEQSECVVTANYSCRSLLRVISDILDFSRIEAGRLELTLQPFDFAATVRSTLGMFLHQAEQKRIRFALELDRNIPQLLVGDDARVRQIIFNLVGNAFKFTEKGEIIVRCRLLPRCGGNKRCIYLAVRDTGIGIPDERLDDIFRAFTQIDGSSTRRYAGSGLGLAIVQRLVRLMDGNLTVDSELGIGTTVHCSLPFAQGEPPKTVGGDRVSSSDMPKALNILVAEDDPVNQYTLRILLTKAGHICTCVNDGRQALEALMMRHFDCLITDIQMPVMDGMELAGRIREGRTADLEPSEAVASLLGLRLDEAVLRSIPSNLPIVALTAHAMSGDRERFLGMGMDYYLAKPVISGELQEIMRQVGVITEARTSN